METILDIVQIFSLIALIIYVYKTWEMASATRRAAEATEHSVTEMRETRDQETAPHVVVYFEVPYGTMRIFLVVKNIGRTTASQVKLNFSPPITRSEQRQALEKMSFINDGIQAMPPNYEIRTLFDWTVSYFKQEDLPRKYEVSVSYYGGLHDKPRRSVQILDLSIYENLEYTALKDMTDLVEQFAKLVKKTDAIRQATENISLNLQKGILISNSNLLVSKLEPEMFGWTTTILAKTQEFESIWLVSHREERLKGLISDRLRAHILLISDQLLALHAYRPQHIESDLLENMVSIAESLRELSQKRLYIGRDSLNEFNKMGDAIIEEINALWGKDQGRADSVTTWSTSTDTEESEEDPTNQSEQTHNQD